MQPDNILFIQTINIGDILKDVNHLRKCCLMEEYDHGDDVQDDEWQDERDRTGSWYRCQARTFYATRYGVLSLSQPK